MLGHPLGLLLVCWHCLPGLLLAVQPGGRPGRMLLCGLPICRPAVVHQLGLEQEYILALPANARYLPDRA